MRVFFCVRICMVHTVHDGIGPWTHIGRSLGKTSENQKETFPEFVHIKGTMGGITVPEKCLREQ